MHCCKQPDRSSDIYGEIIDIEDEQILTGSFFYQHSCAKTIKLLEEYKDLMVNNNIQIYKIPHNIGILPLKILLDKIMPVLCFCKNGCKTQNKYFMGAKAIETFLKDNYGTKDLP